MSSSGISPKPNVQTHLHPSVAETEQETPAQTLQASSITLQNQIILAQIQKGIILHNEASVDVSQTLALCNFWMVEEEPLGLTFGSSAQNHIPAPSLLHFPSVPPSPGGAQTGHQDPHSPHFCYGFLASFFERVHWELYGIFLHNTSNASLSLQQPR